METAGAPKFWSVEQFPLREPPGLIPEDNQREVEEILHHKVVYEDDAAKLNMSFGGWVTDRKMING